MDTGERLSAYLAGELDTDETRALEAELARDPAMRARLATLRRLEDELGGLPPVEVPADFSASLRSRLRAELDTIPPAGDELARRRAAKQQRSTPAWFPALAGAAAVLAVVVGGYSVFGNVFGGSDGEDAGMTSMSADSAATESGGEAAGAEMAEPADSAEGPIIVVNGVAYDERSLETLPEADLFQGIVGQRLSSGPAEDEARAFLFAFPDETREAAETAAQGDGAEEDAAEELPPNSGGSLADLQTIGGPLDDTAAADIGRCLAPILEPADTLIPVYVELATFQGEDVIVYGFASLDRDTGEYTRIEVWAVSRADCAQLFFSQQDR